MPIFTSWGLKEAQLPHCLTQGEGPPRFKNGTHDPDCEQLFWRIEAATHEEAMAIYHLRQGWEPYNPGVKAMHCPECGSLFYAEGSGQCWKCEKQIC